jgi:hypothetical protein
LEEVALQCGSVFHGMDLALIMLHGNINAEAQQLSASEDGLCTMTFVNN